MNIVFKDLVFTVTEEGKVGLTRLFGYQQTDTKQTFSCHALPEFDVAGGVLSGRFRTRGSEETKSLRYATHSLTGNVLTLVQKNEKFEVTSVFQGYDDTNAVRITQSFKNISGEPQTLTVANTFGFCFGKSVIGEHKDWYFHRFTNARYTESMPDVRSLYDMGFYWNNGYYNMSNVGNVSALYNVPQGILENRKTKDFFMFQIESYSAWQAEISVTEDMFNLQLGGPNSWYHSWNKVLADGASYETVPVAICYGHSVNDVAAQITWYRRHIKPDSLADRDLPSIYNEYMHFSWDDPYQERAMEMAPVVARAGCKYYVIDCGWHDSREYTEPGEMYYHFGTWYEDRGRFPDGIKAVAEEMHRNGMKFGLWIAPEVVGCKNEEMLAHYDDDCFMIRNGKKIFNGTGYLLDYSHPKVRDYMTKTIDRMVNEYGCDYIKFDGCPNPGTGGELGCTSLGDGLEHYINAFTNWSYEMTQRHPNVIFEDCAGGGMRTDYKALSIFSLISTSDQINYMHYPYITGNIFVSVLPEQAAVWSYPVNITAFETGEADKNVSKECVVINMMNAVLGRIHLASRIHLLDPEKQALIQEGIEFYNRITPEKLQAVPYLPKGYAMFGDTLVSVGLRTAEKIYLGVWNLHGEKHVELDLPEITAKAATVCYPLKMETNYYLKDNRLIIDFTEEEQGRIFEITLA